MCSHDEDVKRRLLGSEPLSKELCTQLPFNVIAYDILSFLTVGLNDISVRLPYHCSESQASATYGVGFFRDEYRPRIEDVDDEDELSLSDMKTTVDMLLIKVLGGYFKLDPQKKYFHLYRNLCFLGDYYPMDAELCTEALGRWSLQRDLIRGISFLGCAFIPAQCLNAFQGLVKLDSVEITFKKKVPVFLKDLRKCENASFQFNPKILSPEEKVVYVNFPSCTILDVIGLRPSRSSTYDAFQLAPMCNLKIVDCVLPEEGSDRFNIVSVTWHNSYFSDDGVCFPDLPQLRTMVVKQAENVLFGSAPAFADTIESIDIDAYYCPSHLPFFGIDCLPRLGSMYLKGETIAPPRCARMPNLTDLRMKNMSCTNLFISVTEDTMPNLRILKLCNVKLVTGEQLARLPWQHLEHASIVSCDLVDDRWFREAQLPSLTKLVLKEANKVTGFGWNPLPELQSAKVIGSMWIHPKQTSYTALVEFEQVFSKTYFPMLTERMRVGGILPTDKIYTLYRKKDEDWKDEKYEMGMAVLAEKRYPWIRYRHVGFSFCMAGS